MSREIPSLKDSVLKVIARFPVKVMTERGVEKLLAALDGGLFRDEDIVQTIVSQIIEAGRMTDEAVPAIIYRNRSSLFLSNSKISGRYLLDAVSQCSQALERIDVSGCFQVDDGKLCDILESCPRLVSLNVRNCRKLTDRFLDELVRYPQIRIEELDIGGNFNITDEGVRQFLNKSGCATRLTHLNVSGLRLFDDTVEIMTKRLRTVRSLGLGYLDLSEQTWSKVLRDLGPQLEKLDISWPSTVPIVHFAPPSADLILRLVVDCPNLVDLDLTGSKNFTFGNIVDLVERRYIKTQENPPAAKQFQCIRIKFIGSPKATLENQLKVYMEVIKFIL